MPRKSPKTNKSTKSKSFVGTVKRQSKAKLAFLGFAAVLLLTTLGYVGFSAYKANSLNAKAAGYKTLYHDAGNGYMIRACRYYTVYGSAARLVYNKPRTTSSNLRAWNEIHSTQYNVLRSTSSYSWWGNEITVIDTYAESKYYRVSGHLSKRVDNVIHTGKYDLTSLPDC